MWFRCTKTWTCIKPLTYSKNTIIRRTFGTTSCIRKKSPHDILGVSPDASEVEIKDAYYKKIKSNHPDLNPDDPTLHENFLKLKEAYNALRISKLTRGGMTEAEKQEMKRFQEERRRQNHANFMKFEDHIYARARAEKLRANEPLTAASFIGFFGLVLFVVVCFVACEVYEPSDETKKK